MSDKAKVSAGARNLLSALDPLRLKFSDDTEIERNAGGSQPSPALGENISFIFHDGFSTINGVIADSYLFSHNYEDNNAYLSCNESLKAQLFDGNSAFSISFAVGYALSVNPGSSGSSAALEVDVSESVIGGDQGVYLSSISKAEFEASPTASTSSSIFVYDLKFMDGNVNLDLAGEISASFTFDDKKDTLAIINDSSSNISIVDNGKQYTSSMSSHYADVIRYVISSKLHPPLIL